jgi:hypothetical protein
MPSGSELRRPVRRGTDQRSDDLALATGDLLERGSIVSLKRELNPEMAITRRLHGLDVRRITLARSSSKLHRERFGTDTVTAGGGDASLGRKAATWIEGFLVRAAGPVLSSHSSARDRSEREGRCS